MDIIFLQIGGTIDKCYPSGEDNHGYAFEIGDAAYLSVIGRANLAYSWSEDTVMKKDSRDMTDEDRAAIRNYVDESGEEKAILTHGTDTIHLTAETLSDIEGKTIVLTGAMQPEKFRDSDADFNLGMAVAAAQCLPHGVYIALRGEVKRWDEYVPR